jgi:hypothetical protein
MRKLSYYISYHAFLCDSHNILGWQIAFIANIV